MSSDEEIIGMPVMQEVYLWNTDDIGFKHLPLIQQYTAAVNPGILNYSASLLCL